MGMKGKTAPRSQEHRAPVSRGERGLMVKGQRARPSARRTFALDNRSHRTASAQAGARA